MPHIDYGRFQPDAERETKGNEVRLYMLRGPNKTGTGTLKWCKISERYGTKPGASPGFVSSSKFFLLVNEVLTL
jgi:hypothetical protein